MPEHSTAFLPIYSIQPSPVVDHTRVLNFSPLSSVDLAGNVVAFARVSSDTAVPIARWGGWGMAVGLACLGVFFTRRGAVPSHA